MIKISPSLLAADLAELKNELKSISDADFLHVDIMDGTFVPNLSFGIPMTRAVGRVCDIPMDVHLMITHPQNYIEDFAKAGAEIISFHAESDCNIAECITKIKNLGKKPGLVINPATEIDAVLPYLDELYMVLIMTVQPGFGGQKCREECFEKVRSLREEINRRGLSVHIEVDGGITTENAPRVIEAGADILVAGSSVFGAQHRNRAIAALRGN